MAAQTQVRAWTPRLVQTFLASAIGRYLMIGGLSYVVDVGLLFLLAEVLGAPVWVAGSVSYWTGVLINFSLNRRTMSSGGRVHAQAVRYGVLLCVNFLVTLGALQLGERLSVPVVVAKTVAVVVLTGANFGLYRRWVFA